MSTHTQHARTVTLGAAAAPIARSATRDDLVLGGAVVTMGLLAGLFYGFACSVMPGLHAAADRTVVDAMQQINMAIENPAFFATFLGGPALAVWALVIERRRGSRVAVRWLVVGVALAGVALIVTAGVNIPLNNELENAGDPSRIADIAQVRDDFETPWIISNLVRTLACVGSVACLACALVVRGRGRG